VVIVVACTKKNNQEVKSSPFLNVYGNADYLGSEVCSDCHVDNHATFMHTGMGMSFDSALPAKSVADFDQLPIFDSINKLYYKAFWTQNKLYIKEWQLNDDGDTSHKRTEQISYIIGSGHHTNSHFWVDNGYVFQAPITWYVQEKKWGLPPGYETNNVRFSRKIELECMSCHNSLPNIDKNSTHKYLSIPKGIGCESCHGPGSIHVGEKKKGIIVDTKTQTDYTIVNPKRLPWKLQIDICQRCHLQGNAVLKEGKTFGDFRPGMALSEVMQVYLPTYDNQNHDFIMASHAERFQMSQCFIKSNKESLLAYNSKNDFTCISCHNPHVSVRETNTKNFNLACNSCHTNVNKNGLCSENKQNLLAANYNCVQCHMPLSGTKDIPHVSIHDHYIRKPLGGAASIAPKAKIVELKSINGGKEDDQTRLLAYLTYAEKFDNNPFYIEKAKQYSKSISLTTISPIAVHYLYNIQDYKGLLLIAKDKDSAKVKQHFMAYRLAQGAFNMGDFLLAKFWYHHANILLPKQPDYILAEAINFLKLGDITMAEKRFKAILILQSKYEKAYYYLGKIYLNQQKRGIAKEYFIKAINLNPFYEDARRALALL